MFGMKCKKYLNLIVLIISIYLSFCVFAEPTSSRVWVKANTHTHTTNSDGVELPATVAAKYKSLGYNILAITDHWYVTPCYNQYSDFPNNFMCINSEEMDVNYHVNRINIGVHSPSISIQYLFDSAIAEGGFGVLAHPTRDCVFSLNEVLSLNNVTAIEIYNGGSNAYALEIWDSLLKFNKKIFGVAADDMHYLSESGRGWTKVYMDYLTRKDYVDAMKAGYFYSSQGPSMDVQPFELVCDGTTVYHMGQTAKCSSITARATISATNPSYKIQNIDLVRDGTIIYSKTDCPNSQNCSFTYSESVSSLGYYRLQAKDSNNKWIWSNPIWIDSLASITINPDKTISIDGKKTFPVGIYGMCNSNFEFQTDFNVKPCTPSDNSDFLYDGEDNMYFSTDAIKNEYKTKYEQAKIYFSLNAIDVGRGDYAQSFIDSPYLFSYQSYDEPELNGQSTTNALDVYNKVKARDTKHPVILNLCCEGFEKWAPYTDILSWDTYTIREIQYWPREDSIYAYEQWAYQNVLDDPSVNGDVNKISKPVWAVIQANGVKEGDRVVPTPHEARANTYTAITMDVKGIVYWSYLGWGGSNDAPTTEFPHGTTGLYNNLTLHAYYKQLAREIKGLNDILVLPTKDYSWHYHPGTMVSFSKDLTKTVLWATRHNFNYILKQSGATHYLIVVNKDSRPISDVEITISGLTGAMTAKTLGLETTGSSRAGRTLTVTNGKFTDSFDGYAAHIYEISSGAPTCTNDCSPSGTKACTSDGLNLQTCGDYNGDGCLEWKTETCPRVEIGNWGYGGYGYLSAQDNPKLTWDEVPNLYSLRPNTIIVWQNAIYANYPPLTDFTFVQSRFDLATNNKDKNWQYGTYLLLEELFHPAVRAEWFPVKEGLKTWEIEGKATFAGVEVKRIKTWLIEDKHQQWDQAWWDSVKAADNCYDPIVKEWSVYYGYNLHKAWHQHMRNLGKKSAIAGIIGLGGMQYFESWTYPSPMWEYVTQNYDLIFTYQYPECINGCSSPVSQSVDEVKQLREKYNYKGKIVHILTTIWPDGVGTDDETVQFEEFKAVYPYVDVIIVPAYLDVDETIPPPPPWTPAAPRLINFWESYKPCQSGNCISTSGVIPTPPTCTLNSVSIAPQCSGGSSACKAGEKIKIDVSYSGDCPSTSYIQIDAKSSDGACDIQGSGGDMLGIQTACTSGSCTGYWTIPAVAPDCLGKTVSAYAAGLYQNNYNPSNYITGKSGSFGSFSFAMLYDVTGKNISFSAMETKIFYLRIKAPNIKPGEKVLVNVSATGSTASSVATIEITEVTPISIIPINLSFSGKLFYSNGTAASDVAFKATIYNETLGQSYYNTNTTKPDGKFYISIENIGSAITETGFRVKFETIEPVEAIYECTYAAATGWCR